MPQHKNSFYYIMHHKGERSLHSNQAASNHNQLGAVTLFATNPCVSTPAAHISVYYKSLIFIKSALACMFKSLHPNRERSPCFRGAASIYFVQRRRGNPCMLYTYVFFSRRRAAAHRTTCAWTLVTAAPRRLLGISPARAPRFLRIKF